MIFQMEEVVPKMAPAAHRGNT